MNLPTWLLAILAFIVGLTMAGLGNGWWEKVQERLFEAGTKFLAKFARKRLDRIYRTIAGRNAHQLTVIAAAVSCWLAVGFIIYGQEAFLGQNITDAGIIAKGDAWIIAPWTSDNEKLFYEIKRQEIWHTLGAVLTVFGGLFTGAFSAFIYRQSDIRLRQAACDFNPKNVAGDRSRISIALRCHGFLRRLQKALARANRPEKAIRRAKRSLAMRPRRLRNDPPALSNENNWASPRINDFTFGSHIKNLGLTGDT
jgi:hypothetical protein